MFSYWNEANKVAFSRKKTDYLLFALVAQKHCCKNLNKHSASIQVDICTITFIKPDKKERIYCSSSDMVLIIFVVVSQAFGDKPFSKLNKEEK